MFTHSYNNNELTIQVDKRKLLDSDAIALAKLIKESPDNISKVNLSNNKLTDGPVGLIFRELYGNGPINENIKEFDLSGNSFVAETEYLAKIFGNTKVQNVNLSHNQIPYPLAKMLITCFNENSDWKQLDLRDNAFDDGKYPQLEALIDDKTEHKLFLKGESICE